MNENRTKRAESRKERKKKHREKPSPIMSWHVVPVCDHQNKTKKQKQQREEEKKR
jgi:hypothetical protein